MRHGARHPGLRRANTLQAIREIAAAGLLPAADCATLAEQYRVLRRVSLGLRLFYATIGAIGFEGRLDYGAIGTVTNLAARLCGEAAGGQILISARAAAAVEGMIEAEDVGPLTLKGLARPVPIWSVRGLR